MRFCCPLVSCDSGPRYCPHGPASREMWNQWGGWIGVKLERVRRFCTALPHATEAVQWEDSLVFKIGGKMFAVAALEPGRVWLSFKCTPEDFGELTERNGVIPAPYLARASWVALEDGDALSMAELGMYLRRAYEIVRAKLPRRVLSDLA